MTIGTASAIVYSAVSMQTQTKIVLLPSQSEYEQLVIKYSDTLQCPCATFAVPFGSFVETHASFHQVCMSEYVSQTWIDLVYQFNSMYIWPTDVRTVLSSYWQLIAAMCRQSKNALSEALANFGNMTLITPTLLSAKLVYSRTNATFDTIRRNAQMVLVHPLTITRRITRGNQFISGLGTNYYAYMTYDDSSSRLRVKTDSNAFFYQTIINDNVTIINQCNCWTNGPCAFSAGLYLYEMPDTEGGYALYYMGPNFTIPGIIVDCVPTEAILASTLECFYDAGCIELLLSVYPNTSSVVAKPLVMSNTSTFLPNTTIETLVNELFAEKIDARVTYAAYYAKCAPLSCSFTVSQRLDVHYIITTIISLFGGLSAAFYFLAPYLVKFRLTVLRKLGLSSLPPAEQSTANNISSGSD